MLSKTDWLIEQQIARYFSRLSAETKIGLLARSPSVSMNEDEGADADNLTSEVETDRTGEKIRKDLAKLRRRLQGRVQLQFGINKHLLIFSKTTNCTRPTGSCNFVSL